MKQVTSRALASQNSKTNQNSKTSSKESSEQESERSAHFSQSDNAVVEKDSRRVNRVDLSEMRR